MVLSDFPKGNSSYPTLSSENLLEKAKGSSVGREGELSEEAPANTTRFSGASSEGCLLALAASSTQAELKSRVSEQHFALRECLTPKQASLNNAKVILMVRPLSSTSASTVAKLIANDVGAFLKDLLVGRWGNCPSDVAALLKTIKEKGKQAARHEGSGGIPIHACSVICREGQDGKVSVFVGTGQANSQGALSIPLSMNGRLSATAQRDANAAVNPEKSGAVARPLDSSILPADHVELVYKQLKIADSREGHQGILRRLIDNPSLGLALYSLAESNPENSLQTLCTTEAFGRVQVDSDKAAALYKGSLEVGAPDSVLKALDVLRGAFSLEEFNELIKLDSYELLGVLADADPNVLLDFISDLELRKPYKAGMPWDHPGPRNCQNVVSYALQEVVCRELSDRLDRRVIEEEGVPLSEKFIREGLSNKLDDMGASTRMKASVLKKASAVRVSSDSLHAVQDELLSFVERCIEEIKLPAEAALLGWRGPSHGVSHPITPFETFWDALQEPTRYIGPAAGTVAAVTAAGVPVIGFLAGAAAQNGASWLHHAFQDGADVADSDKWTVSNAIKWTTHALSAYAFGVLVDQATDSLTEQSETASEAGSISWIATMMQLYFTSALIGTLYNNVWASPSTSD